jgi:hypothetical protein
MYGKQFTIYEQLIQFGQIRYITVRTPVNNLDDKAIKCGVMIGYYSENHSGEMIPTDSLTLLLFVLQCPYRCLIMPAFSRLKIPF